MGAPADPLILSQRSRIVRFAVEHRIPATYEFREFVSDGDLLSYGPNLMEMFRRSATYADGTADYMQIMSADLMSVNIALISPKIEVQDARSHQRKKK